MVPWDSQIRWQFGGNLQRVRLICDVNWRECPLAIANYIWSEIVTDVVECVTNESILLRLIILILVCTIFLHTIWTRTKGMTDSIVSKNSLNRVDCKIQDLELRVNVLTYKIQYGTWPSPQQINGTNIEEHKDSVGLSLSSSGSHNLWLNQCLDSGHVKNRHISRSENLGLRSHKPKTLIETSRKIYYDRPNEIRELQLLNDKLDPHKKFERLNKVKKGSKKCRNAINNGDKYILTAETRNFRREAKIRKSILKKYGRKKEYLGSSYSLNASNKLFASPKFTYNNVPVTTTAESSCEDSGNPLSDSTNITTTLKISPRHFSVKKSSPIDSSASFKRINATQETLANVKERLESLHTVLKTYGSQHNLKSCEKESVKEQLAKAFIKDFGELHRDIDATNEKPTDNIVSESTESNNKKDQNAHVNFVSSENDENKQIDEIKDEEKNSQFTTRNDEIKSTTLTDTDEDSGSISSQSEPLVETSESDKSMQSSDVLMMNALLNQLDLTNLQRWNNESTMKNTEHVNEYNTESIFPKIQSFCQSKFLDIISEEQSGSSCTEKTSKTIVHTQMPSTKTYSSLDSPIKLNQQMSMNENEVVEYIEPHIIDKNTDIELHTFESDIKVPDKNSEKPEETKQIIDKYEFDNNENIPELSKTLALAENETVLSTVKSISAWDRMIEHSSEESIGSYLPNVGNFYCKLENEIAASTSSKIVELDNLFDIQNGEQLIDIPNITLTRRPGVFSMTKSTNTSEQDSPLTLNDDSDLIDLNFDDNEDVKKTEGIIFNNELNVPLMLINVPGDILNAENIECMNDGVPITERTVIWSNKYNDDNESTTNSNTIASVHQSNQIHDMNSCKNIDSKNLIELEQMAYEELTQVENSWYREWTSKRNCEEISISDAEVSEDENKKFQSHGNISSTKNLSTPSSIYLTVQESCSDISKDSSPCLEYIEKIEVPEEVKNIDKLEDNMIRRYESFIVEPKASHYRNKSTHEIISKSSSCKNNEDEECKDSALSETPQPSLIAINNTVSNEKLLSVEISSINSSIETSSYVDANSHNLMSSSGISLSFDRPQLTQSLEKITVPVPSLKKSSTHASVNSIKVAKEKNVLRTKTESKISNKTKIHDKLPSPTIKAKSNLNLTRENSMISRTQKSDKRNVEFGQYRSRSYIAPRKHETASITKFHNSDMNTTNSKNNSIDRRSKIKFNRSNSLSTSRESVNRSTSKSHIPVFKNRLDATKNIDCRPRSPLRGPLTMYADIERNPAKKSTIEQTLCPSKNDNGDNETKIHHDKITSAVNKKLPAERQTVIYVNIVTDHDNCVTRVVDPKKFLECVKNKDLNNQEIINKNCYDNEFENNQRECSNAKFVTVISSAARLQREIEVLAKPSVIDTSTSISDLPKTISELKELTDGEYIRLLQTLREPSNFYEFQKIRQACNQFQTNFQE